ncbi:MAG: archease [Rhodanobacteraceae bacterium]|jgi:SHS2 domain-containing protein|nr:archease [Rhodanobacteraceae bacterium]
MKAFDYFAHDADIGIVGRGATTEKAFEAAAEAMFAIMAPPPAEPATMRVHVGFVEADAELALVTWLNRLLAEAQLRHLRLSAFQLVREGDRWTGEAAGTDWARTSEPGVEVKGATLTGLAVRAGADGVEARCVVDV